MLLLKNQPVTSLAIIFKKNGLWGRDFHKEKKGDNSKIKEVLRQIWLQISPACSTIQYLKAGHQLLIKLLGITPLWPLFPASNSSLYLATRNWSSGRREHIFPIWPHCKWCWRLAEWKDPWTWGLGWGCRRAGTCTKCEHSWWIIVCEVEICSAATKLENRTGISCPRAKCRLTRLLSKHRRLATAWHCPKCRWWYRLRTSRK